jgi:release factor glutamine methyltransferase
MKKDENRIVMLLSIIQRGKGAKFIKMLMEHFCKVAEIDILKGRVLTNEELELLEQKIDIRVSTKMPVQYIIGEAWFMGEYFKVSPDVLIPRDETEMLVAKAIELIKENNFEDVLDIGTGSGCIACTIAKQTNATVLGVDISTDALRIALDNVTRLGINNRAIFRKSDLFDKVRDGEVFDVIVSNPPYIPYGVNLSEEVMHEPELALFAEGDGTGFYKIIIEQAKNFLNDGGFILFELGIGQSLIVKKYFEENGFKDVCIEKDLAGIDRVIEAHL